MIVSNPSAAKREEVDLFDAFNVFNSSVNEPITDSATLHKIERNLSFLSICRMCRSRKSRAYRYLNIFRHLYTIDRLCHPARPFSTPFEVLWAKQTCAILDTIMCFVNPNLCSSRRHNRGIFLKECRIPDDDKLFLTCENITWSK